MFSITESDVDLPFFILIDNQILINISLKNINYFFIFEIKYNTKIINRVIVKIIIL